MKIKICGIYENEAAEFINDVMPDYAGFVFFEKSHRNVTEEKAKELRGIIDKSIPVAGVFVNEDIEKIVRFYENKAIDIIQLHGQEDEEYIKKIRERLPYAEVWKAFKIRSSEDIKKAESSSADMVLLDNGYGTGECFDWKLIGGIKRRFILAGGLTAENIEQAGKSYMPFAADLSSGVETEKKKDYTKMKAAVMAARRV